MKMTKIGFEPYIAPRARPFRNYDDKYRVVLTFDSKEDARKFVEAWNEVHR